MDRRISGIVLPRLIQFVLVGADAGGVHITWMVGEAVSAHPVEYFSYLVEVTGNRGSFIKQFGVKFVGTEDPEVFPFIHDFMSATQANYSVERVSIGTDTIGVHFVDAGVGSEPIDAAVAHCNVNGVDVQERLPVTTVD